jgi:Protein of unknown function (DUF3551)
MRVATIVAAAFTAAILAFTQASAAVPNPGWCLNGGGQNGNAGECVYRTLERCVEDRIGQGGHCDPNPNAGGGAPFRR